MILYRQLHNIGIVRHRLELVSIDHSTEGRGKTLVRLIQDRITVVTTFHSHIWTNFYQAQQLLKSLIIDLKY